MFIKHCASKEELAPEREEVVRKWAWHIPDGGVFGLEIDDADALVALFSHEAMRMQMWLFGVGHQLDHNSCWTVIMTDLWTKTNEDTKQYYLFIL